MRAKQHFRVGRRVRAILLTASLGVVSLPGARWARATSDNWNTNQGGNWTANGNWSSGVPPTSGQDVTISFFPLPSPQTVTFNSASGLTYNSLLLDAAGGGVNVFSMAANNLTITTNLTVGLTGNQIFNQSGGVNSLLNNGQLILANNPNSVGTYILGAGATLNAISANELIGLRNYLKTANRFWRRYQSSPQAS